MAASARLTAAKNPDNSASSRSRSRPDSTSADCSATSARARTGVLRAASPRNIEAAASIGMAVRS
jgi:hypothetical protein